MGEGKRVKESVWLEPIHKTSHRLPSQLRPHKIELSIVASPFKPVLRMCSHFGSECTGSQDPG